MILELQRGSYVLVKKDLNITKLCGRILKLCFDTLGVVCITARF